jgi:hypothetical protein
MGVNTLTETIQKAEVHKNQNSSYWQEKELKRRWEIVKGQTSNQMIEILIARMQSQEIVFKNFNEFLKEYEKQFPRLLEVNQRLLLEGGSDE